MTHLVNEYTFCLCFVLAVFNQAVPLEFAWEIKAFSSPGLLHYGCGALLNSPACQDAVYSLNKLTPISENTLD